jgi:hypothetical protein
MALMAGVKSYYDFTGPWANVWFKMMTFSTSDNGKIMLIKHLEDQTICVASHWHEGLELAKHNKDWYASGWIGDGGLKCVIFMRILTFPINSHISDSIFLGRI